MKYRRDVAEVLKKALAEPGPALVDVEIARGETVYPMVPPGHPLTDMWITEPGRRRPGRPRKNA